MIYFCVYPVGRVDQMKDGLKIRGRGTPRKTLGETIREDLDLHNLSEDLVFDRTHWCCLIHVADPTWWEKGFDVVYVHPVTSYKKVGWVDLHAF